MLKKTAFKKIYQILWEKYGECACPLIHHSPFQLLAAVMLSAQCRDDRVNMVTPELFRRWPTPAEMALADPEEVAQVIRTLGLFAAKSRNLVACARVLVQDFGGEVPQTMEDLTTLPGIGRKSANVVLGNAFGLPGFPVDTHVNRVLNRLGLVQESSPEKIERIVNEATDPAIWSNFSHLLILHGRDICHARKPECEVCPLAMLCRMNKK
ncbi:MAG: endonuclease III [Lentisphaeria bacterium]|nr:endonuclease III [Lentisphaeria bacterium]